MPDGLDHPSTGRDADLARLLTATRRAADGASSVVVVRGPAGSGKSWLLDRLRQELDVEALVLRARGHPAEQDLPFAGLHQLLWPLIDLASTLPDPQRQAIEAALAVGTSTPADRFAVAAGVHGLVTVAAERRPVVLTVDDTHWLDTSTLQAVVFAARRLEADPVAVLLASRGDDHLDGSGFETLDLAPLGEDQARALLRTAHPELSTIVANEVLAHAAGLPLALREIPADLTPAQRRGLEPLPVWLPPGATFERLYRSRLARLDDDQRRGLLIASLEHLDRSSLETALASVGLDIRVLDAAERVGLLRWDRDQVELVHPTVRSAVQHAVTDAERRAAHDAIARTLADEPARQAWHLEALTTGPDAATAAALEAAADAAAHRGAYAEAARAWEAAADRSSDPATAPGLLALAALGYVRCGAFPPLIRVLDRLVEDAADPAERIAWEVERLSARIWSTPSPPDPSDVIETAVTAAPQLPEGAARLLATLALGLAVLGRYHAADEVVDQARRSVPDAEADLQLALTFDMVDIAVGRPGAGRVLRSDWPDQLSDAQFGEVRMPISQAALVLSWISPPRVADSILRRQHRVLQEAGALSQLGICLGIHANVAQRLGDWVGARAEFTQASRLCADTDFAGPLPHIDLRHAYLLAAAGDEGGCRALADRALHVAKGQPSVDHLASCVLGLLELSLGRCEEAVVHLDAAGEAELASGLAEPGYSSRIGDLCEALWRLRRPEVGRAQLAVYEARARSVRRENALAIAARCRGLLGPPEEVDSWFGQAVEWHRQCPDAFELARTQLCWGQRLRRGRRKRDARKHLRVALDAFSRVGAEPWTQTARAELAACGERRRTGWEASAELTPRELEVAVTVARGATNPEAAAALCMSRRTVEYHLTSVYRKLQVSDRAGLAAALGGESAMAPGGSHRQD
ncbi:MAG: AAA family ATPase [Acidimicrobiales bacterium]